MWCVLPVWATYISVPITPHDPSPKPRCSPHVPWTKGVRTHPSTTIHSNPALVKRSVINRCLSGRNKKRGENTLCANTGGGVTGTHDTQNIPDTLCAHMFGKTETCKTNSTRKNMSACDVSRYFICSFCGINSISRPNVDHHTLRDKNLTVKKISKMEKTALTCPLCCATTIHVRWWSLR